MKKFECGCHNNRCFLETERDPNLCVLLSDMRANWQEVMEKEEEMKTIHCIDLDIYGNLTTTSTTTFVENIESIIVEEDWDYDNHCSVQRIVVTFSKMENKRFVYLGGFEEKGKENNGYLDIVLARYLYTKLFEEIKEYHENYAIVRKDIMREGLGFDKTYIINGIIQSIADEYKKACKKHHEFPENTFEQLAIIQEEIGEAIKEWNNLYYHNNGSMDKVKEEIRHTIVTCIRMLGKNEKK